LFVVAVHRLVGLASADRDEAVIGVEGSFDRFARQMQQ